VTKLVRSTREHEYYCDSCIVTNVSVAIFVTVFIENDFLARLLK